MFVNSVKFSSLTYKHFKNRALAEKHYQELVKQNLHDAYILYNRNGDSESESRSILAVDGMDTLTLMAYCGYEIKNRGSLKSKILDIRRRLCADIRQGNVSEEAIASSMAKFACIKEKSLFDKSRKSISHLLVLDNGTEYPAHKAN